MFAPLADLERHAAERPDSLALVSPGSRYSFAELRTAVDATAALLRAEGVKPRQVVALDLPAALEWIVDLALLRLATRSVSVRGVTDLGTLTPDVLVTEPGRRIGSAPLTIELAASPSTVPATVPAVDYARPDSIFRLMLTSGTTGTPRAAAYAIGALERRRAGLSRYWTDGRRELNFMALSTTGGFHTAIADLEHGQTHLAVDFVNGEAMRFAAAERVRVLCGSPVHIASALAVLAAERITLPDLEEVRMAGAAPSATLLRLIAERLDVPVRSVYGSTEGGGVTSRMVHPDEDPANVGTVLPGLELQIVDEAGSPVPTGTVGAVRYRGPGMVTGYLDGAVLNPFPRGWFEPGDTGLLSADGSLTLAGRTAELINVAGVKVNPTLVDESAIAFPGVIDAAAFGFEHATGIAELGLAVVAAPDCDLRALDQQLRRELRSGFPTMFWRVAEIPRNRMGKVERTMLAQAFRLSVGR